MITVEVSFPEKLISPIYLTISLTKGLGFTGNVVLVQNRLEIIYYRIIFFILFHNNILTVSTESTHIHSILHVLSSSIFICIIKEISKFNIDSPSKNLNKE